MTGRSPGPEDGLGQSGEMVVRVGIFMQADETEDCCQGLLQGLADLGIKGSLYRLGRNWETLDGGEIVFNFHSITHFLLVPQEQSFHSRWPGFVGGFALGANRNLVFLLRNRIELPPYLSGGESFNSVDEILDFYANESVIWGRSNVIEQARECLISLGVGINEENFALRVAMGDEESVENFLRIGFSPDTCNAQGVPLVCLAVRNGHRQVVELLLARNVNVNVLSEDRGNSPLMEAANRGDIHSARRFLENGADPNLVSKSGQTALMMAVGEGHRDIVATLLEFNASPDFTDSLGMTARKYARIFQNQEILELLGE